MSWFWLPLNIPEANWGKHNSEISRALSFLFCFLNPGCLEFALFLEYIVSLPLNVFTSNLSKLRNSQVEPAARLLRVTVVI